MTELSRYWASSTTPDFPHPNHTCSACFTSLRPLRPHLRVLPPHERTTRTRPHAHRPSTSEARRNLETFPCKPRSESGLDCLTCAASAQQRALSSAAPPGLHHNLSFPCCRLFARKASHPQPAGGTTENVLRTLPCKPRQESGLDCRTCPTYSLGSGLTTAAHVRINMYINN